VDFHAAKIRRYPHAITILYGYALLLTGKILYYSILYYYLCGVKNEFRIRQYGRTELAMLYSPDIAPESAWKKLRKWIDHFPGLTRTLFELGYTGQERSFTPSQVAAIVSAIGEP